jgi:Protein of unknown function (DUF1194)
MHPNRPLARVACIALSYGVGAAPQAAENREVDVELILAVDVSRSMDADELRLQREGYVTAFHDPGVVDAIRSGAIGKIAVMYFEWAGSPYQSVAVPWTVIGDREDADAFANELAARPILTEAGTSIRGCLHFAEQLFVVSGTIGLRRTIDVSGDGVNNDGSPLATVRDRLIAEGITINGLPIELGGRSEVTDYYEQSVVGGPGAFTIMVDDRSKFAEAIRRKLILEIATLRPKVFLAAYAPPVPYAGRTTGRYISD